MGRRFALPCLQRIGIPAETAHLNRAGNAHPRPVSWLREEIRNAVIPVQTGIHIGCFMAKAALDSGSHPTGLARNDDQQIALTTMNQL
jgi:hypothetical protein